MKIKDNKNLGFYEIERNRPTKIQDKEFYGQIQGIKQNSIWILNGFDWKLKQRFGLTKDWLQLRSATI